LLGEALIPATWDSISGEVLVGDADEIEFDLSRRPSLVHLRLLQEWLLAGAGRTEAIQAVVRLNTSPPEVFGEGIEVEQVVGDDRVFHLMPAGFDPLATYAVTGTGIAGVADVSPLTLELLDPLDHDLDTLLAGAGIAEPGLTVRVQSATGDPPTRGFVVQIERIGGAS
jgi:hypothetical protein